MEGTLHSNNIPIINNAKKHTWYRRAYSFGGGVLIPNAPFVLMRYEMVWGFLQGLFPTGCQKRAGDLLRK